MNTPYQSKHTLRWLLQPPPAPVQGIDEGGVRKELFGLLTKQLLLPDFGMFTEDPETRIMWFNADSL